MPVPLKSNRGDFLLEAASAQQLSWCFPSQDGWLHTFAEPTGALADGWTHCKVQGGEMVVLASTAPGWARSSSLGLLPMLLTPSTGSLVSLCHCSLLHDRGFFSPGGCLSVNLGLAKDKKFKMTEAAVCTQTQEWGGGKVSFPHLVPGRPAQVGREALGSIQPQTCEVAEAGYYNDNISFQRR